tara:strand:+ start:505 stop:723 length:219 start_codon:yes stop_codon:yes gene_type:complete
MAKRRYILELTPSQLSYLNVALELAEMDLTGGYGYESEMNAPAWKPSKTHIHNKRIKVAISEAKEKGLKTIK